MPNSPVPGRGNRMSLSVGRESAFLSQNRGFCESRAVPDIACRRTPLSSPLAKGGKRGVARSTKTGVALKRGLSGHSGSGDTIWPHRRPVLSGTRSSKSHSMSHHGTSEVLVRCASCNATAAADAPGERCVCWAKRSLRRPTSKQANSVKPMSPQRHPRLCEATVSSASPSAGCSDGSVSP